MHSDLWSAFQNDYQWEYLASCVLLWFNFTSCSWEWLHLLCTYHILSHPVCHQSASTQGQCELQLMASYAMKTVTWQEGPQSTHWPGVHPTNPVWGTLAMPIRIHGYTCDCVCIDVLHCLESQLHESVPVNWFERSKDH